MSQFLAPSRTSPYSTVDHIQHGDHLLTARELVVHLGEAVTRAIHYKTQATIPQEAHGVGFWSRVCVAIGQVQLPEGGDPDRRIEL